MLTKQEMVTLLRENICLVTFTKRDGTQRVMEATLKPDVAVPYEKKTGRFKFVSEDILPVWDVESSAWRSFHVSSVTNFETDPAYMT